MASQLFAHAPANEMQRRPRSAAESALLSRSGVFAWKVARTSAAQRDGRPDPPERLVEDAAEIGGRMADGLDVRLATLQSAQWGMTQCTPLVNLSVFQTGQSTESQLARV